VAATAMCAAGFLLGFRIRRKRFDRECRPLLEQLLVLQASLKEAR
jgi:hypothetical protein